MDISRALKVLLRLEADTSEIQSKLNPALEDTKAKLEDIGNAGREAESGVSELGASIGTALGFGAVAAVLAIKDAIEHFGESWRKVDEDINAASAHLNEQVAIWAQLAAGATDFATSVNIAGKAVSELTVLTQQLAKVQATAAGEGSGFVAKTLNAFASAANFGGGGPLDAAKAAESKRLLDEINRGLLTSGALLKIAGEDATKWNNDLANLPAGVLDEYNSKLDTAKQKLAAIDPTKSVADLKSYQAAAAQVELLTGQVDKLSKAQAKRNELDKEFGSQIETLNARAGGSPQEIAAAAADKAYESAIAKAHALGPLNLEQVNAAEQIRDLTYQTVLAQQQHKTAAQGTTAAHRELRDTLAAERIQLDAIRADVSNIEENPFLTLDQKNAALSTLIPQQIQAITTMIEQNKAQLAHSFFDPAQHNAIQSAIQRDEAEITKLNIKLQSTTFGGQFRASLVQWVNQFGTTAQQVGNIITSTIGTAVSGVSNAITGAIFRTQSWGQAFAQVAQSIVGNIIQIALQWAVSRALMALLNITYGQTEAAAGNAQATAAATAWSPAAIAASIASYGAAAAIGNLAYISALISGTSFAAGLSAAGSFETGGFTGAGGSREVAGIVHRGEYVFPQATVSSAGGPRALDNLRSAIDSGKGRGSDAPHIYIFTDKIALQKHWQSNPSSKKQVIDWVNGAGGNLRT